MLLTDAIRLALRAVTAQRLRSFLTLLGIAVGIASVILLTSIGEGIHRFVLAEFTQFGTNIASVSPGKVKTSGPAPTGIPTSVRPLTLDDARALLDAIDPKAVGANTWQLAWLAQERARILAARGDTDAAMNMLREAEADIASGLGAQHPDVWLARIDRAELLARMGKHDDALRLAQEIARKAAPGIAPDGYWALRLAALSKP